MAKPQPNVHHGEHGGTEKELKNRSLLRTSVRSVVPEPIYAFPFHYPVIARRNDEAIHQGICPYQLPSASPLLDCRVADWSQNLVVNSVASLVEQELSKSTKLTTKFPTKGFLCSPDFSAIRVGPRPTVSVGRLLG